jgi:hypothetical protein
MTDALRSTRSQVRRTAMRRSWKALTITAAVLLVSFGAMTLASAANNHTTVLHLVHKRIQTTNLDLGAKGSSPGDQMIFADDVFRDGKKVGTAGGACTAVRVTGSAIQYHCQASVRLPKGQLSGQLWPGPPSRLSPTPSPGARAPTGTPAAMRRCRTPRT